MPNIADDNTPYKRIIEVDPGDIDNPPAGAQVVFIDSSDHLLKRKDSSGTVTIVGSGAVDDTAYDASSWNGDTTHAPSKNAVRDKIESLSNGSLTTASANLGADVTLTAGSWTDVLSLSLAAGTWVVWASMHLESGAVQTLEGRITDGTTVYASAASTILSAGVREQIALISEPIVLGGTTTIKLQGFTQSATTAGKAKQTTPSGATKATHIRALKVA